LVKDSNAIRKPALFSLTPDPGRLLGREGPHDYLEYRIGTLLSYRRGSSIKARFGWSWCSLCERASVEALISRREVSLHMPHERSATPASAPPYRRVGVGSRLKPVSYLETMVWVPGGTFQMGSTEFYPEEEPVHTVTVDGFWMDCTAVTNEEFSYFVLET